MAIDKALYTATQPNPALPQEQSDIEIEIDNPDAVTVSVTEPETPEFSRNLAEEMDDRELATLASELLSDFDDDINSRKDWIQTYVDGLDILGLQIEERDEPWPGSCGVQSTLLAEAAVKFQAETMMATMPAAGPVKTQIIGKETPEKKAAATRVAEDMNYQLTDVMTEYRPEHERMLWGLSLAGNAFKKVYYDPSLRRQVALYVPAEDVVIPYGASSLETAPRVTHVMRKTPNELARLQAAGFYLDTDLGDPVLILDDVEKKIAEKLGFRATADERYKLLEMQVELDFENENEPARPYIVTIEKGTATILAVRRNWEPDDETYQKRQHLVHYGYVPGFGFYCFGLIHLVGGFAKSGTSLIRQLIDSGTLSNLPGGFKTRGLRIKGDDSPIEPGEFRDVDVPSGALKDNLMPLPYKEPSQTLLQLLSTTMEWGERFANTSDLQISDMSGQTPVGTTLAILERVLKPLSAIQARVYYAQKQELKLLKAIIADYTPEEYAYEPTEGSRMAKKADYDTTMVIPVSDPNASTMAQKIVQYQAVLQLAQGAPQLYNLPVLHRQMLEVLGIKEAQKLIPMGEDLKPMDPVTENQAILMMRPVKAYLTQDHQAHITVHMAAMHDPKIMSLLQANPQAPAMQAQMMAHINEHLGFEYRKQIEAQLGAPLPPQTDAAGEPVPLDPATEAQLAPLLAQAATQLLHNNLAEQAQQQAQQQAQDPLVQLQQQEMQLKQQDLQRKVAKDQSDAQLKQQELQLQAAAQQAEIAYNAGKLQLDAGDKAGKLHTQQASVAGKLQLDAAKLATDTHLEAAKLVLTDRQQSHKQPKGK